MKDCKGHTNLIVKTKYVQDKPAQVLEVGCMYCEKKFPKLKKLYQERENETFKACGDKSPYILFTPDPFVMAQRWMKDDLTMKLRA